MDRREGSLGARPFALLLSDLAAAGATGALKLQWGLGRRTIYFTSGQPVFASGVPMLDNLGTSLVGARVIGPSVRSEALRRARAKRIPIGAALLELGALGEAQLEEALAKQLENRVLEPLTWTGGEFHFAPGVRPPNTVRARRDVHALLDHGLRLGLTSEPMKRWFDRIGALPLTLGDVQTVAGLEPDVEAPLALARSGLTVRAFFERAELGDRAVAVLTRLLCLRLVSIGSPEQVRTTPVAPARDTRAAEKKKSRDADTLLRMGRVCLSRARSGRSGFADAAAGFLMRAAELAPSDPAPLLLLAEAEKLRGHEALS
ncbi:MAG: DUF4388 domain-containing protein, partial [Myxococcales bacterium]